MFAVFCQAKHIANIRKELILTLPSFKADKQTLYLQYWDSQHFRSKKNMFPTKCWLFFLLMIINLPCVYLSKKAPQLKPTLLEPPERETLLHLTVRADFFRILAMYCFFLNLKAATYNFHRLRQVSKVYIRNCFFAIVSHGID